MESCNKSAFVHYAVTFAKANPIRDAFRKADRRCHDVSDDKRFFACSACGRKVERAAYDGELRFCIGCGRRIYRS